MVRDLLLMTFLRPAVEPVSCLVNSSRISPDQLPHPFVSTHGSRVVVIEPPSSRPATLRCIGVTLVYIPRPSDRFRVTSYSDPDAVIAVIVDIDTSGETDFCLIVCTTALNWLQ